MITFSDAACSRCRIAFEEDDERWWALDGNDLICAGCISPFDRDRGVVESETATCVLHLALGHAGPLERMIAVLEQRMDDDDGFFVWSVLDRLPDLPLGRVALAQVAYAAVFFLAEREEC